MLATKEVPLSIANPFTGGLRFFLSSFKRIAVTLRSGLAIVLIGLSLGTFSNCASQEAIPPESGAYFQAFGKWRRQVESYVQYVKTAYPQDSDRYKEAQRRYIGAETKANALIDRLLMDFSNGVNLASSEVFDTALDLAFAKSGAFLTYLETSANSRDSGMSPQTPIDRQSLKLESLQLSEEYRTAHTPRREVLRSQLREMKWKAFEDL
jgi:hypothetical protein